MFENVSSAAFGRGIGLRKRVMMSLTAGLTRCTAESRFVRVANYGLFDARTARVQQCLLLLLYISLNAASVITLKLASRRFKKL